MQIVDILTWLGLAVAGLALTALVVVAALSWLLNHPADDDKAGERAP